MNKSEIYIKMLGLALQYIRYIQSLDKEKKGNDMSCYYESNLVHNLAYTILNEEFDLHDINFLNYQAKNYIDDCSIEISLNYDQNVKYIQNLFRLVPLELRDKLIWDGPL